MDFGGVQGIAYVDSRTKGKVGIYNEMITALTDAGYEVGKDLFGVPYDWRLTGDAHSERANGVGGLYPQLKALIEKSVQDTNRKAIIVSHSLGCPTMLYFFNKFVTPAWLREYISNWVAMAGPWSGGAAWIKAYLGGYDWDVDFLHDYLKDLEVTAPSGLWMIPMAGGFHDEVIVRTPSRNYTAVEFPEIVRIIGEQAGGQQILALLRKKSIDIMAIQRPPPYVATHVWYGFGVATHLSFDYDKDLVEGFNFAPTRYHDSDGDGLVNLRSAQFPQKYWPHDANAPVSYKAFHRVTHSGFLRSCRVITNLFRLLGLSGRPPCAGDRWQVANATAF